MTLITAPMSSIVVRKRGLLTRQRSARGEFPVHIQKQISELALEIKTKGNEGHEPVLARLPEGRFLLVSGEARYYAMLENGLEEGRFELDESYPDELVQAALAVA